MIRLAFCSFCPRPSKLVIAMYWWSVSFFLNCKTPQLPLFHGMCSLFSPCTTLRLRLMIAIQNGCILGVFR